MKKNKLVSMLLALVLIFGLTVPAMAENEAETTETTAATAPAETEPQALAPGLTDSVIGMNAGRSLSGKADLSLNDKAALLYEINSGTMVYAYNIDTQLYPASLTKVMTCLVALENGNLDDIVTVSEEAVSDLDPDGSNVALQPGEEMSLREMLYCVMLASANDACPVVAEHIAGSEAAFVQMMNDEAQRLGCTGTHFANTHGLHDDAHYTTARDLLRIFSAALENDFFRELYGTVHHTVPATNLCGPRELSSTDLMKNDEETPDYLDSRVEGGKTGFTTPAGRCFICTARDGDLHYISIVLGAENEYLDSGAIVYHNFMDTESLLDLGFDGFAFTQALSPEAPIGQVSVSGSVQKAVVAPSAEVTALLPADYDTTQLSTSLDLNSGTLQAPLEAGTTVGAVRLFYKGICVAEAPLVTMNAVRQNVISYLTARAAGSIVSSPWRLIVLVLFLALLIFGILLLRAMILRRRHRRRSRRNRRR